MASRIATNGAMVDIMRSSPHRPPFARLFVHAGVILLAATACQASKATCSANAEEASVIDLAAVLRSNEAAFGAILAEADALRLKIEVAVVERGPEGPTLLRDSLDFGPEYFYPASSIKTCAVIAAFKTIDGLRAATGADIDRMSALRFHPLFEGEVLEEEDSSHLSGSTITAAHDARKVFLVSDNAANNRLYELSGPAFINETMRAAGLTSSCIVHRLSEFRSAEDQLRTPRIEFLDGARVAATVEERTAPAMGDNAGMAGIVFGLGHVIGSETREGPMSFLNKNYMSLRDLQDMNVMMLRPDVRIPGKPADSGFGLSDSDRAFVRKAMAGTPGLSRDPVYSRAHFGDDDSKFLGPGLRRIREPGEWTIRDKVGRAYGFSTTNSEVVDHVSGRTMFVTATIYTNPNQIVGDGVYDYERADAFFADLGEALGRAVFSGQSAE